MNDADVLETRSLKVETGELVVLVVKEGANFEDFSGLTGTLRAFAEDLNVTVLIFQEDAFADLTKLGLASLLDLKEQVDQAICSISTRDFSGDTKDE